MAGFGAPTTGRFCAPYDIRKVLNRVVGKPGDGRDPDRVNIEATTLEADGYEAQRQRKRSKPSIFERIETDDDEELFSDTPDDFG